MECVFYCCDRQKYAKVCHMVYSRDGKTPELYADCIFWGCEAGRVGAAAADEKKKERHAADRAAREVLLQVLLL